MVPGMFHCGGGPGPNTFDMLTALDQWVVGGVAPDAIPATGGSTSACASLAMPLCKFPEVATYTGGVGGNACIETSWSCNPENEDLLKVGLDGHLAGLPYSYLGQ